MVDAGSRKPDPHEEGGPPPTEATNNARYQAFISYSHAADGRTAPALRDGLHRLARPLLRTRAMRVFLDEASLSANPGLWSTITDVLAGSEFFILLASPQAAASEWVGREVAWWRAHKPATHLLIGLTEGTIAWDREAGDFDWKTTTALPPDLRGMFVEEPLYVDLRWSRDAERLSLVDPRFRDDVADFAAFISKRDKDELLGEDVRQHRRLVRVGWTAIVSLSLLLVAAIVFGVVAVAERDRAQAQARLALSRQLAAQSTALRDDRLDRSLLLSLEALKTQATAEAQESLLAGLRLDPELEYSYQVPQRDMRSLAFDDERHRLVWGTADEIVVWDVDRRTSQTLPGPALVSSVTVSSSGVIAASGKDTTMLWSPDLQPMRAELDTGGRLSFSGDGTVLVVMNKANATFWDVGSGERRGEPMTVGPNDDAGPSCPSVSAISPDLRRMAFATSSACNEIVLWDVERGAPLGGRLTGHAEPISDLVFSPDGSTLASASGRSPSNDGLSGRVRLWDVAQGTLRSEPVVDPRGSVTDLAFSRDGRMLAAGVITTRGVGGIDGVITLVNLETGTVRDHSIRSGGSIITGLAFGPGRTLASIATSSVDLWEIDREDRQGEALLTVSSSPGRSRWVDQVAISRDGKFVAVDTVTFDAEGTTREITVWNLHDRRPVGDALPGGDSFTFSPTGRWLAVREGSEGDTSAPLVVWDLGSRQRIGPAFTGAVGCAFSPDRRTLAVGREDGTAVLWDLTSQREVGVLPARLSTGPSGQDPRNLGNRWLAFGQDGATLSVARQDGLISNWSLDGDRRVTSEFHAQGDEGSILPISTVEFSPDRAIAVVAVANQGDLGIYGSVSVWDTRRGSRLTTREGAVSDVAFTPDGKRFTTVDPGGSVLVWDVDRMRPLDAPVLRQRGVSTVAVGPDGTMVVGSISGVTISTTNITAWQNEACRVFGRSLTPSEWTEFIGSARPYAKTCAP